MQGLVPVRVLAAAGLRVPGGSGPHVVLVTGASSGIGRATALLAAERGDRVALMARSEGALDDLADECVAAGAESADVVTADVTDDASVARVVDDLVERHGRIDAVLHCAGVVTYGRTEDVAADDFEQVVSTNLLGSATVARHVIPVLRRQRYGVLVLVGSLLGHVAVPDMTPYVVSKWGVRALAKQLSLENADLPDVHVVHVAPGSVDTPIYGNALDSAGAVNTPPPPVISPERVARVIYRQLRFPTAESQTAFSNYAMIWTHNLLPFVWRRAVGPVFRAVSHKG
ncbi:SDR family NAD(P)-dependent oxidoreductase [Nocardioides anomalus]|uniref:SDR family NAD(P)-dependent oxidoreductase n=1 Tax=Nocardioides anomalus TaxID=2712223 RepID=A0A6G6WFA1_9ACTN|nr:SDR family NAD(P)-dependent oxidoreductase [Nocardioides anomalus]QIG43912.1 SDR family NAD(P)-dependent oxidoreductase [Nocardioides anomalus]